MLPVASVLLWNRTKETAIMCEEIEENVYEKKLEQLMKRKKERCG